MTRTYFILVNQFINLINVYRDLKNLVNWLNAKNIYLNAKSDGVSNFYTPKENIRQSTKT